MIHLIYLLTLIGGTGSAGAPIVLENAEAVYPPAALRDRVGASIVLRLSVDTAGRVEEVAVIASSMRAEDLTAVGAAAATSTITYAAAFAESAIEAARRLRFAPWIADGQAVPFELDYTVHFELPPRPEPAPPTPASGSTSADTAAGPINLRGVVRKAGVRRRLAGALVIAERDGASVQAITDEEGAFSFAGLTSGDWKVTIDLAGYTYASSTETVRDGEALEVDYYLEENTTESYDVVVEAARVHREVTRRALTIQEIVHVPGTLGDPVLVIENLPGVARTGFDGGNVVRGSAPQDSISMIEGVPILIETHFGGFRSVIAPQLVERIDFFPGNFSTRYGRRTGGALDVRLKKLEPDQLHGELEVSVLDAGLYLEAPLSDTAAIAVAGRRSHIDFVLDAATPDDADVQLVAAPRYYDYQALASWRPSPSHSMELFVVGSDDRMQLVFTDVANASPLATESNISSITSFQRATATYRFSRGESLVNELQLGVGGDQIRARVFGQFNFHSEFINLTLRDHVELRPSDGVVIVAGIDAQRRDVDYDITAPRPPKEGQPVSSLNEDTMTASGNIVPVELGVYTEAELELVRGLTLIPGLRADYYSMIEKIGIDPRVIVRYSPIDILTLRAGVALVHQLPELDELVAPFGNPDLRLIRGEHYSLGAEVQPFEFLSADVTLFAKDLDRLVDQTDEVIIRDGTPTRLIYDNHGEGRVYGLELLLRHRLAHDFEGWLAYTLSRSERTDSGAGESRLFDYDQTHILTFVGTYHFGPTWSVGARWRYVSGRPVTPILGGIWRADLDEYEPIPGRLNTGRLPAFHQLDVRIDKRWVFDTWELSGYLSLSNAYNRGNVEELGHNFDYSATESVKGLPLLPILGIKGRF